MIQPIIVTGGPRSGTTLTMRILQAAGMQLGRTAECADLREGKIRDQLYKPILKAGGYDPLAQDPLPPVGWYPDMKPEEFREKVIELAEIDDLNKPWGFKAIKGLLFWRLLHDAFPEAEWVFVERATTEHTDSLMRTIFMRCHDTHEGWEEYLNLIEAHAADAWDIVTGWEYWPSDLRKGDFEDTADLIKWCGLQMNDQVYQQFNPGLYKS